MQCTVGRAAKEYATRFIKNECIQRTSANHAPYINDEKASKKPLSGSSPVTAASGECPVTKSGLDRLSESTGLAESIEEPAAPVAASNEDTDVESVAEDSDVDSNDPNIFDEGIFDYDSDGEMVEYYHPPLQADNQGTPLERFLASLSEVPAEEVTNMEKCQICNGAYKVLGVLKEVPVRLLCTHVVGKECLGVWLGPVDEGGWGSRKCPVGREGIVVPGE